MIRVTVETHPHERYHRTKNMQCQQNWWLELFLTLLNQQITTSTVGFNVSANRVKTELTPCIVPKKWKVWFPIPTNEVSSNKTLWIGLDRPPLDPLSRFYLFFLNDIPGLDFWWRYPAPVEMNHLAFLRRFRRKSINRRACGICNTWFGLGEQTPAGIDGSGQMRDDITRKSPTIGDPRGKFWLRNARFVWFLL